MSGFVSDEGLWSCAKEKVVLKNQSDKPIINPSTEGKYVGETVQPGEDFVYEGPDRRAMYELFLAGEEHFGINFRKSPEFLELLRKFNFKTEKEYLKFVGYDTVKAKENFEKNASIVSKHELPKKVKALRELGGGRDFSGQGNDRYGDFGSPPELSGVK